MSGSERKNQLLSLWKDRGKSHLQQLTAAQIRTGLDLAKVFSDAPKDSHAEVMQSMAELMESQGYEPYSSPEVELLSRLAVRYSHLADPEQVDLDDPEVQMVNRELAQILDGHNQRKFTRGEHS